MRRDVASKPFVLSYSNESDAAVRLVWFMEAGASGRTVAIVPEPATALLWLLGLAGLGVARRRR